MTSGWLIDLFGHFVFWIVIPALLIFSAAAPFLFIKKILKRRFTFLNMLLAAAAAAGLLALDAYGLYWSFALLQGIAFCQLHGGCQSIF